MLKVTHKFRNSELKTGAPSLLPSTTTSLPEQPKPIHHPPVLLVKERYMSNTVRVGYLMPTELTSTNTPAFLHRRQQCRIVNHDHMQFAR